MPKEPKTTVEQLFGESDEFSAGGNKYKVLPLVLTDAVKYGKEGLFYYKSMGYVIDPENELRERVNYWFGKALRTDKDEVVTVDMVEGKWTTKELRNCLRTIGELAG